MFEQLTRPLAQILPCSTVLAHAMAYLRYCFVRCLNLQDCWFSLCDPVDRGIWVLYLFAAQVMACMPHISLAQAVLYCVVFPPGDRVEAVHAGLIMASLAKARPASLPSRA